MEWECLRQILDIIAPLALIATLGVIIWYACETRQLRIATVKQTELSLSPCVVLDYKAIEYYSMAFYKITKIS